MRNNLLAAIFNNLKDSEHAITVAEYLDDTCIISGSNYKATEGTNSSIHLIAAVNTQAYYLCVDQLQYSRFNIDVSYGNAILRWPMFSDNDSVHDRWLIIKWGWADNDDT